MSDAPEFLVEIEAWTGFGVETLYVATCDYVTSPADTPANRHYLGVVSDPGSFRRELFGGNLTMGASSASFGIIELASVDGALDAWLDYGFDGRPLTVKRLASRDAPYSSAVTVLRASVERLEGDNAWSTFRLRLYDRLRDLDVPLQGNLYVGTTLSGGPTANGTEDQKDAPKPLAFGRDLNVLAVEANPFDHIYQVNDGPVAAIAVFDGGVALTLADVPNYATLLALQSAPTSAVRPGKYATCLALGLFRLGGKPEYSVTANVTEGATVAERYAGAVATRILAKMGIAGPGNINAATFAALDAAAPYEVGTYIVAETTALAAISEVLASVGAALNQSPTGLLEVHRFTGTGVSVAILEEADFVGDAVNLISNPDSKGGLPAWRIVLGYARCWQVQEDNDLAYAVPSERRGFLGKFMRETKAESAAVKVKHLLAPEQRIDTLLVNEADAATEAARRLPLYSVRRDVLSFDVEDIYADALQPGVTVTMKLPRFGYGAGRDMVIIAREEKLRDGRVALTVWG